MLNKFTRFTYTRIISKEGNYIDKGLINGEPMSFLKLQNILYTPNNMQLCSINFDEIPSS